MTTAEKLKMGAYVTITGMASFLMIAGFAYLYAGSMLGALGIVVGSLGAVVACWLAN